MNKVSPIKKRKRKQIRDYQNKFGMAYQKSGDKLLVSVPDRIKYPSCSAWVWLQDTGCLIMSAAKPKSVRGVERVNLLRQPTTPGCRIFYYGPVSHGLGSHFRMMETKFHTDGGDRFQVFIPPEDDRLPPRGNRHATMRERKSIPAPAAAPQPVIQDDRHLVLIERGEKVYSFRVPDDELRHILGDWLLKGYQEDES